MLTRMPWIGGFGLRVMDAAGTPQERMEVECAVSKRPDERPASPDGSEANLAARAAAKTRSGLQRDEIEPTTRRAGAVGGEANLADRLRGRMATL